MPEGAKAVMHHLRLDLVVCCNFSWREAHNKILLRRSIALDCLRKTLPPIDEDRDWLSFILLSKEPLFSEGNWQNSKRQTRSVLRPSLCSLRQQRPLSLILPIRMSDEERVFLTGRALRNRVDGAGDRAADPCQPPLSLGVARKPLTASTIQDSNKRKVEPWDDTSQTP